MHSSQAQGIQPDPFPASELRSGRVLPARQLCKLLQSFGASILPKQRSRVEAPARSKAHAGAEDVQRTMYSLGNSITSEDFSSQACKERMRHRSPVTVRELSSISNNGSECGLPEVPKRGETGVMLCRRAAKKPKKTTTL